MSAAVARLHPEKEYREAPCSIECEQALIGSVLANNDVFRSVSHLVSEDHFFEPIHARTWHAISGLIEKGQNASRITLKPYLGDAELAPGTTLMQYLARLDAAAEPRAKAIDYARMVADLWGRRQIIATAQEVIELAYDAPVEDTSASLLSVFESRVEALRPRVQEDSEFETFDSTAVRAVDAAAHAYQQDGRLVGLPTGMPALDDALGGLHPSDLIIVAGRPGMGKSSLAANIGYAVAERLRDDLERGVVGFSSLEMSAEQLSQRIISERSGVPNWKVRRGKASKEEMARYVEAARELRGLPLRIDQTGGLTIGSLRMRVRSLHKRLGLKLLIIDYLQLLSGSGKKGGEARRVDEVTEITTGLKALAKELHIPIIALSQLSRRVEERDDKRPMLSDLRESGSIEQDADVVLFVFREEYYLRKHEPKEGTEAHATWQRHMWAAEGVADIIIAKQRHGPEGTVRLGFDASLTKFLNEPPERGPEPEGATKRERQDKPPAPKGDALTILGVLKSLTLSEHSRPATDDERAADRNLRTRKNPRIIPIAEVKARLAQEFLGCDEAEIEKKWKAAFSTLRANDLVFYTGTKEAPCVWLPKQFEASR